jgi:hypothetical protein
MGIIEDLKEEFEQEATLLPGGPPYPVDKKERKEFEKNQERYTIKKKIMDNLFKKYLKRDFEKEYDIDFVPDEDIEEVVEEIE